MVLISLAPIFYVGAAAAAVNAEFSLSPASKTVTVGSNLVINLNLDTGGNAVLAWKTTINYSATYFDVVSVQTDSSSHFDSSPSSDVAAGGTIKVSRYATSASSTSGPVIKITLRTKKTGTTSLSLAHICTSTSDSSTCSAITGSSGTNLLSSNSGGSYTVTAVSNSSTGSSSSSSKKSIIGKVADAIAGVISPSSSASEAENDGSGFVAKRGVVQIKVLNQNKHPIDGAKVVLAGISGKTNAKGIVTLAGVYPGDAKGTVSYQDRVQDFTLDVKSDTSEESPQTLTLTFQEKTLSTAVKALLVIVGLMMIAGIIDLTFISKGGFKEDVSHLWHHDNNPRPSPDQNGTHQPGSVIRPNKK